MKTDIEIAQNTDITPIAEIAKKININEDDLELYGKYKAKLPLELIDETKIKKSKLILVTAITPTPAGEGKTTISIGLSQAMNQIDKKTTVVLREPSLGPVFGIKGGATGGGHSQVVPMEDINLHFTGDLGAVEKANNLLAALIDNNLQLPKEKGNLNLDPRTIKWKRVMDLNDRALRDIVIGLGGTKNGVPREAGFNITAASEVMAILCLAKDFDDLKTRLGNIFVGLTYDDKPIFARDLKAEGAMAVLLKDAIKPNLVQTLEGTPAIIHGGPFANIAQGTNSIIATKMGMSISDYVVTEAGFASELGAEKFMDIKMQMANLKPSAVVIVATIRALKYHGGVKLSELEKENIEALELGLENLGKHIENMQKFGFTPVVAINKFYSDTENEIKTITEYCTRKNIPISLAESWEKGGMGTLDLADKVVSACEKQVNFTPLYDFKQSYEDKIESIAKQMYGATKVEYTLKVRKELSKLSDYGLNNLAVCIAKTQKSLSDKPLMRGLPKEFTLNVRELEIASGAGFIIPIAGTIMRMPGLPAKPASEGMDIDEQGNIVGLF